MHGFQGVGFGRVILRRRGLQALPLPLFHELIIFCGSGPGRRVGRQATGPLGDHIAQSSASFSLMAPHALRPHAKGARASRMVRWRVLIGICEVSVTRYAVDWHTGCAGYFAGRIVWPDWGREPTQQIGKIGLLGILGIWILIYCLEKLGRVGGGTPMDPQLARRAHRRD
jgi:hypothetical protein